MLIDHMSNSSCSGKKCPRKFITSKMQDNPWKEKNSFFLIGKKDNLLKKKKIIDKWVLDVKSVLIEEDKNLQIQNDNDTPKFRNILYLDENQNTSNINLIYEDHTETRDNLNMPEKAQPQREKHKINHPIRLNTGNKNFGMLLKNLPR